MAETKGDQEGLSASVPGALAAQSFGIAWQRPLIPKAAPSTPALPSVQGARAPAGSRLPRPGCGRRLKQMLTLPGQGDPAQTRAHSALGRNPDTRALVRVRKPQSFLELNYSLCCEQGAGAKGRAPGTGDRLPSRAPAPHRPKTRDCVAAPLDSHRPGKGASSRPSGASQPPNCKQNVEIPRASLA